MRKSSYLLKSLYKYAPTELESPRKSYTNSYTNQKIPPLVSDPISWYPGPISWYKGPISWFLDPISWFLNPISLYLSPISWYLGPISQTNSGELLVYPGAILHMECLFLKKFGSPSWSTREGLERETET